LKPPSTVQHGDILNARTKEEEAKPDAERPGQSKQGNPANRFDRVALSVTCEDNQAEPAFSFCVVPFSISI
jgi:hypothetical protein